MNKNVQNLDPSTVESFGDEWSKYDQHGLSQKEGQHIFEEYFSIFPWDKLPSNAQGFDMGCGSGRWAKFVAPKVAKLNCIDPSKAIEVAKKNLTQFENINYIQASVASPQLAKNSQDFGYSLGVLHHIPNTENGIKSCVDLLKPGAPFLIYLYYAFDNRPLLFKLIWKISDFFRRFICALPSLPKLFICKLIAMFIYFPLAKLSLVLEKLGLNVENIPLCYYRNHSFYTMSTDARDRFGTPLEKRFTKIQIEQMMKNSGLKNIKFSDHVPFWCAVGIKS
ncbi:class I SAM-dependent methyltransferase [Bacteriovoracaceae bacterium]|nr:class I SAM-dependent methyltransferase [Bacteriovoracaceae bacterium]